MCLPQHENVSLRYATRTENPVLARGSRSQALTFLTLLLTQAVPDQATGSAYGLQNVMWLLIMHFFCFQSFHFK